MSKTEANLTDGTGSTAHASQSQLWIIDLQDKLGQVMAAEAMQLTVKNAGILAQVASLLAVPLIVTEQYPQGLGATVTALTEYLNGTSIIAKSTFSACKEPKVNARLHRDKPQIILAGMEAHICVLQTALDLLAQGKQVFVVEDAVISRNSKHQQNALARMQQAGCIITITESVVFEWLGDANHAAFKNISKLIK